MSRILLLGYDPETVPVERKAVCMVDALKQEIQRRGSIQRLPCVPSSRRL